ncbi:hypothetical protein EVAR_28214_1 [Eumeta japonica]|uniref:Uncharacterized protein n=1 Tax=Eumeta variegata TaxID=151549 RepID=A0A4C1VHJ3_EUMVA|nr:hypothetical protein EVAR_28214_1 [Eumeta japonica]
MPGTDNSIGIESRTEAESRAEIGAEIEDEAKNEIKFEIYLSPVETYCSNVDYFIPDENNEVKGFSDDAMTSGVVTRVDRPNAKYALTSLATSKLLLAATKLHMARSTVALFIVAFAALFVAFWTGVVGCWKRSPGNITATAILMLLTCLLAAGAMALWHGVEFYENEKLVGEEYYQQWPNVLKDKSSIYYGWSYVLAWLSVAVSFGSSMLFFSGAICLSKEKRREQQNNVQYIMPEKKLANSLLLPLMLFGIGDLNDPAIAGNKKSVLAKI